MSDDAPEPEPEILGRGIWFWRVAIIECFISVLLAIGTTFLATSAVWTDESLAKMTTWRWWIFAVTLIMSALNTIHSFMSKTVATLTQKAKDEDSEMAKD